MALSAVVGAGAIAAQCADRSFGFDDSFRRIPSWTPPFATSSCRGRKVPIDYYAEYLEADRFGTAAASASLAEYVRRKYRRRHIDLVIAMTNDSLQFVLDHRDELFPDVPIVFAGIAVPDENVRRAGHGIAVVRVGSAYVETLKLALELHPSTERVFVVARSPNQQNVDSVRAQLRDFSRQVQLTYLEEETLPRLLRGDQGRPAAQHHPPHLAAGGCSGTRPIRWKSRDSWPRRRRCLSTAPSISTSEPVSSAAWCAGRAKRASRVGEMALQILEGSTTSGHSGRGRTARADLRLAPAQAVGHRSVAAAGQDRTSDSSRRPCGKPIVRTSSGRIVVVAAQLLAIAGLLVQRARRRRAEETVLAREATIRASYERIRQLAGRLINAQEAARASIARDLHDGVCQELAGVSIAVGSLKSSSGSIQDAHTQQALSKIHDETLGMFEGIRRLSHDLHPATLRLVGLATALQAHCVEVEKRHAVQRAIHGGRRLRRPPPRCRRVFLPNRAGVASKRRRARRSATTLGLARPIGRSRRPRS